MTAVATAACRGGEIRPLGQHLVMDALLILLKLIGGNLVRLHIFGVTVASTARLGHLGGIGPGHLVFDGADSMHIMATAADGNVLISFSEFLAMGTGIVLLDLVCSNRWIECPHIDRIAMTLPAGFRDRLPQRFTHKPLGGTVTLYLVVERSLIPAVAVPAAQAPCQMVIVFDLFSRTAETLLRQCLVAIDAGIHRDRKGGTDHASRNKEESKARNSQGAPAPHGSPIEDRVQNIQVL